MDRAAARPEGRGPSYTAKVGTDATLACGAIVAGELDTGVAVDLLGGATFFAFDGGSGPS